MVGIFYSLTPYDIAHWPTPNYVDPVHRQWLPGYAIAFEIVATVLVMGRLCLRGRQGIGGIRSYGLDDAAIIVGWAFSVALTALGCLSVWEYGIGRHVWDVDPKYYDKALAAGWLAQIFFILSSGGTKMSVFLFYCRLLKGFGSKKWIYLNWFFTCLTAGIWVSGFVAECFMCTPLNAFWNYISLNAHGDYDYHCINGDALSIATAVLTIGSDFWTAAIPCALMQTCDLGLTKRQKIAINIIFCLGFIVTGIGGVRTYYLWEIGQREDLSWIGYDLFASAITECQFSVICTCAPFCRAFIRRYLPSSSRGTMGSRAAQRISATSGAMVRGASVHTVTSSKEGLRFPGEHMELHDLDDSSDGGEPHLCVLFKDEKTGKISLQTRTPRDDHPFDRGAGSGEGVPYAEA